MDRSWKAFERRLAKRVGGKRIPVTGERATQMEHYFQLVEELQRVHKERIEGLIEHLDIKDQLNAQLQRELEDYVDKIAEYVELIMRLEKEGDDVF